MRTAAALAVLCAAVLPAPHAAAPAPRTPPAPAVSVAVTDGVDRAEPGMRLDYRVTVRNLGTADLPGARIEQELPATTASATATGGTAEQDGAGGWRAVWHADLPAHGVRDFSASAVLGTRRDAGTGAAAGTLRAATTVCVHAGRSAAPLACSGDLDDLPAPGAEPEEAGGRTGWAVAAAACALFGPGVVRAVRRGRARRAD
ncbi:hypothetical protein ADL22_25965 [Streptomyces sp. NRRL F-4489]|uniref:hypothetical protein n=1 Tax=Streptomyces sp. NRRL F-4489 TaxID=1609095 RepID=UPI00074AC3A1|nr:hypothetical protein [Streptomyces sp. NRRL F-4489]KUL36016.1 hypothetical protein ADL22_25965 [Streptomyces sp. NRRL F-4489]